MNEYPISAKGVKLEILRKPAFEMVGYKRPANLGDGSIGLFLRRLEETGKLKKLAETVSPPGQIWVCLSDCQSCGLGCSGFHVCCRVCLEKTPDQDFSGFQDQELSSFSLPASEWARYEARDRAGYEELHRIGVYELVKEVGYQWNESIRLHFDNEHECCIGGQWVPGKVFHFLLPVVSAKTERPDGKK